MAPAIETQVTQEVLRRSRQGRFKAPRITSRGWWSVTGVKERITHHERLPYAFVARIKAREGRESELRD